MKKALQSLLCIIGMFAFVSGVKAAPGNSNKMPAPISMGNLKVPAKCTATPFSFIENKGEVTDQYRNNRTDIQFRMAAANGLNIFIGNGAIHYQFSRQQGSEPGTYRMDRMDMMLLGANKNARLVKEEKQDYYENYFTDWCGDKELTAHAYNKIVYKDVYPHIDWVLYVRNGVLEHEFVVRKGGKVSDIQLQYGGAAKLEINADGSLTATTAQGTITEKAPVTYEAGGRKISSAFKLNNGLLSYETGSYNGDIIIDPTLGWATYYGGSGDENANSLALDASGNIYMSGGTNSVSSIATTGAYQTTFAGGLNDGILVKFSSGGARLWATYFGGSGDDYATGDAVDAAGNIYIGGLTASLSGIATGGAYQPVFGGGSYDGFLAKFDNTGAIQWSTYYGGSSEDRGYSVAADASGHVYLEGYTGSTSGIATVGSFQSTFGGAIDIFLVQFNSSGVRQWATYYGDAGSDYGNYVTTDASGNVYVDAVTSSPSGLATAGAHQTVSGGGFDALLVKFDSSGARQWATYFGGSGYDKGYKMSADTAGNIYMSGQTQSTSGIATLGAYQTGYGGGTNDGFLAKFSSTGTLQWATYFGSAGDDYALSANADALGNVYLGGQTSSTSSIATSGGYQLIYGGGAYDGFLAQFSSTGTLGWSTYYGGNDDDGIDPVITDAVGNIYFAGHAKSTSGIATGGAYQTTNGGSTDAFLAKFVVCATPLDSPISGASTLCVGGSVGLTDAAPGGVWTSSAPGVVSVGSATGVITGIAAGSATITYTVTNACGSTPVMHTVTVSAVPPAPSPITGVLTACAGSSVTLSDATPGGTWSSASPGIATIGSAGALTAVSGGLATISYTVTNSCGSAAAVATFTVAATPATPAAISGLRYVCIGDTTALSEAVGGGVWSSASPGIASIGSTGTVTGIAPGVATIHYTITTACGSAFASAVVTVNATAPTVSAITGTATACTGNTTVLSDSIGGGVWSSTASTIATVGSSSGVVTGVSSGTALISYTVNNGCGTATSTVIVTVNPSPVTPAAITGAPTLCEGTATTFVDGTTGGVWSSTNTGVATVTFGVVSGIAPGVATIRYTVSNGCGSAFASKTITVNPQPAMPAAIGGASMVCVGSAATLTDAVPGGAWSASSGGATVNTGGVVTGVSAGTLIISYTISNSCGSNGVGKSLTVNALPIAGVISGDTTVCPDSLAQLTSTVPGGMWSTINGHALVDATGVIGGNTPGYDTIIYTVRNVCGSATATYPVTVWNYFCRPLAAGELQGENEALKVYPNPNAGTFTVNLVAAIDEQVRVTVTDVTGKTIKEFTAATNKPADVTLNTAPGIYLLSVYSSAGMHMAKVVVE